MFAAIAFSASAVAVVAWRISKSRTGGSGHKLGHEASYSSSSSVIRSESRTKQSLNLGHSAFSGVSIQPMPAYHTSPDLGKTYNMLPDLGNAHQMSPNIHGASPTSLNIATLTPYGLPSTEYHYDEPRFQHVSVVVTPIRTSML
jgi:hypothetical protein